MNNLPYTVIKVIGTPYQAEDNTWAVLVDAAYGPMSITERQTLCFATLEEASAVTDGYEFFL